MELGVQVVGSYDHVAEVAGICEEAGIAAVALADHYLYGRDPADWSAPAYDSLVQAAVVARDTSTVEVVMLVSPITFRHPAVYAKTITTIDEISGGRFVFGLGTGWHDGEHEVFGFDYPPMGERFTWLEDALGYLRTYIDDPTTGYEGTVWSRAPADLHPRARQGLRLLVGGGGAAKTPRLVGTYADEYNLYHHTAEGVTERLDVMRRAAEAAGRDPDAIVISTCQPIAGGADEAEIDAFFGDYAAARGQDPATVREQFMGRIPIATWDEHRERLAGLEALGFTRVYLQAVGGVAWAVRGALDAFA